MKICPFFSKAPKCPSCGAYSYIKDELPPVRACFKCGTLGPVEGEALAKFNAMKATRDAHRKIAAVAIAMTRYPLFLKWCEWNKVSVGAWHGSVPPAPADDEAINACLAFHDHVTAIEAFDVMSGLDKEGVR